MQRWNKAGLLPGNRYSPNSCLWAFGISAHCLGMTRKSESWAKGLFINDTECFVVVVVFYFSLSSSLSFKFLDVLLWYIPYSLPCCNKCYIYSNFCISHVCLAGFSAIWIKNRNKPKNMKAPSILSHFVIHVLVLNSLFLTPMMTSFCKVFLIIVHLIHLLVSVVDYKFIRFWKKAF